ncbi:MAG: hypothetical protein RID93_04780 [Sandaracinaceae bacterium]
MIVLSASCGPVARGGGRGTASGGGSGSARCAYTAQCRGDFGASAAANEFETFMSATWEFHQAAVETQETLLTACQDMGRALEMPAAALSGSGPEGTREVCTRVAETLRTEWQAVGADTSYTVEIQTTPPRCEARFEAYASCAGRCDVNVQPGELEMRCEGGEIRGQCSGGCTGQCAVEVQAQCSGTCEGICEGECSQRGPNGECAGRCQGTCRGECVTDASASCSGECRGSCSVEWQEPYCTGHYDPPQVNADCRAACEASVEAQMECRPGQAEVIVSGGPGPEAQARLEKVRAAVRAGLASVQLVHERVERMQRSGRVIIDSMQNLPDAIRTVGVSAAACSAGALSDLQQSLASVSVSVEVSVSVSASVNANAG